MKKRPRECRPRLEILEDRLVPRAVMGWDTQGIALVNAEITAWVNEQTDAAGGSRDRKDYCKWLLEGRFLPKPVKAVKAAVPGKGGSGGGARKPGGEAAKLGALPPVQKRPFKFTVDEIKALYLPRQEDVRVTMSDQERQFLPQPHQERLPEGDEEHREPEKKAGEDDEVFVRLGQDGFLAAEPLTDS